MRNFRSTLFLLVVVVGLLAYFFFIDRHQKGTAERESEKTVLFGHSAADADSLKITGADGAVVLDKKDGAWKIRQPIAAEANSQAVDAVLSALESLEARRIIELSQIPNSGDTLQQWGLAPGNVRVEFSGADFSDTLLIGRKTALSDLVYARALHGGQDAEAPVALIPADSGDAIGKKLSDLRSRALLKGDLAKVSQLGITIAPGTGAGTAPAAVEYEIDRQGDDWKFQKPLTAAANGKRVTAWLQSLGRLRVKQFISDDASNLSTYGLSSPVSQFWVQSEGAKGSGPDTLLIGLPVPNTPGEVYAKRLADNAIVTVASAEVDKLLHDLPDVRDRHVLAFNPDEVTALRIDGARLSAQEAKGGNATLAVAKQDKGEGWIFDPATVPPVSGNADADQIKAFLGAFKDLEAAEIVSDTTSDLKPYGLDHPSATLLLTLKKGDPNGTVSLLVGRIEKAPATAAPGAAPTAPPSPASRFYAKNSQEPFIYAVDASFLDKLPKDGWTWLDPAVTTAPPGGIKGLTVTPQAGAAFATGAAFTVTRGDAGFSTDRTGVAVDPAKANAEFSLAGNLRALRWLGPPEAADGLAKPQWTVKASGDVPFALLIGAELPDGGRAAQIVGQPFVFVLADADVAAVVTAPFASEGIHSVTPAPAAPAPAP